MLPRWSTLLVVVFMACGRHPMGPLGRDAARLDDALAPMPADGPALAADACVPLVCQDPTCFPSYCGRIGDGCGSVLDCGGCAAGWSCRDGQCFQSDCTPFTCDNSTPFPYCGSFRDACGGPVDCTCDHSGGTCVGGLCMPEGCVPIAACTDAWGGEYCGGPIGDGCGGVLDCSRSCSRVGFSCRGNVCVDSSRRSHPYDSGALDPLPPPPPVPPLPPLPPCPPPPTAPGAGG